MGVRGFQLDGKPDEAVALMKTTRIYPLAHAANPPKMTFVNGSHQGIDTTFSDTSEFFDDRGVADRARAPCGDPLP